LNECTVVLSDDLHRASVRTLQASLRAGELSSVELTRYFLKRIERHQDQLNTFITVDAEGALAAAAAADSRLRSGNAHPLTGIPWACKDVFCTSGLRTTCGSRMLSGFVAPYESTATARIRAAGAVMLGKTNMDEFAMGSSNENSFFGPVANPWDKTRVPGGSSGGSAAAVAAGQAPLATGTDTGGSIRQPASFCGVVGLKPTYGRVSRYGMIAFASSLDQGGVFARSAEDCATFFATMAGFDPLDSTSAERNEGWLEGLRNGLPPDAPSPLRLGLPREYFNGLRADAGAILDSARRALESLGHTVSEVDLPHSGAAIPAYYVIAGAEASANLSRFDGVRYGLRAEDAPDLRSLYVQSRTAGFGTEVKRRILTGTYALSVGYYEAYYQKAQRIRRLIQQDFLSAFADVDLLLTPTAPGPAFRLGELTQDPVAMYQQDVYTTPVSLSGLPAMTLPCGLIEGLPFGMQLIAPHFREDRLLSIGMQFQQSTDWHRLAPHEAALS
jgi:aspartyl-tRNA(Asn)/glutamyl-tRNA(Gln) amidotransferase subunit A